LRDGDENPSFAVKPDSPTSPGAFKDFGTGETGSMAELARRLGIDPRVSSNGHQRTSGLLKFCLERRLDLDCLVTDYGVRYVNWYGRPALQYPTALGVDRIKTLDGKTPKYLWARRGKGRAHWYRLRWALENAADTLYIFNGEPAVWGAAQAGIRAICLCGGENAQLTDALVAELREALSQHPTIKCVRIVYDRGEQHDKPGAGSRAIAARLKQAGLEAEALGLSDDLPAKSDADDLRQKVGNDAFPQALAALKVLTADNHVVGQDDHEQPPAMVTVWLKDVQVQTLRWLWKGRIAFGKLNLLVGKPGLGKSFITLDQAARLTTGTHQPDELERPERGICLFWIAEDDLGDTVRPRFEALRGDVSRFAVTRAVLEDGIERMPSLARDLPLLRAKIEEIGASFVVIDPMNAYLAGIDGNDDIKMRTVFSPLSAIAADTGAAIVGVTHTNKRVEGDALERVMGSMAYVGAARSVLAVGQDPDNPGRRVLAQIKSNLSELAPPLGYRLADGMLLYDSDPVNITADSIFDSGQRAQGERSALAEAKRFLEEVLRGGEQKAQDVQNEAKQPGISSHTLRRAREELGVVSRRQGFGADAVHFWSLPPEGATNESKASDGEEVF
jgi:hypothetical protein